MMSTTLEVLELAVVIKYQWQIGFGQCDGGSGMVVMIQLLLGGVMEQGTVLQQ